MSDLVPTVQPEFGRIESVAVTRGRKSGRLPQTHKCDACRSKRIREKHRWNEYESRPAFDSQKCVCTAKGNQTSGTRRRTVQAVICFRSRIYVSDLIGKAASYFTPNSSTSKTSVVGRSPDLLREKRNTLVSCCSTRPQDSTCDIILGIVNDE